MRLFFGQKKRFDLQQNNLKNKHLTIIYIFPESVAQI